MKRTPLAAALALTLVASEAAADLPPPEGQKFVGFALQVDGSSKFDGFTLVAYPWSPSNGAPTWEAAELLDGKPLSIGRRSPTPRLFAVGRDAWSTFVKGKPAPSKEDLEAFFAKATPCNAQVSVTSQLPRSDPRDVVTQAWVVEAIDAKTCRLGVPGASSNAGSPQPSGSPGAAPDGPHERSTKSGGCAGCSVPPEGSPPLGAALGSVAVAALWLVRARRRGGR